MTYRSAYNVGTMSEFLQNPSILVYCVYKMFNKQKQTPSLPVAVWWRQPNSSSNAQAVFPLATICTGDG